MTRSRPSARPSDQQAAVATRPDGSTTPPAAPEHKAAAGEAVSGGDGGREGQIRSAAYALAERRGFEPGHEVDDWLEAERQFRDGAPAP